MMEKRPISKETDKFAGLFIDILQKVRKGKITLKDLEFFVNQPTEPSEFQIFGVIKIGVHKSVSEMYQSLVDNLFHVSNQAQNLLCGIELSESEKEITLYSATGRELTGKDDPTLQEVNVAVCTKGYSLCPAEVGPQFRLQNLNQLPGELIYVAMEPLVDLDSNSGTFLVGRDGGGFWLDICDGFDKHKISGDSLFCFLQKCRHNEFN